MKSLIPGLIAAAIATVGAIAVTASASCVKGPTSSWGQVNTCSAPNQNRGSAIGTGQLGFSNRTLTVTCAINGGTFAIAHGIDQLGNPIGTCNPKANAGSSVSSLSGQCSGGNTHSLGIAF